MENSSNIIRPFRLSPLCHVSSKLEMCSALYLQMLPVTGGPVGQGSGHPETLEHKVGSVADLSRHQPGAV